MRSPLVRLLTTRRFAPLFVTQFLGAFNDNLLKSALGIFVTYRLADQTGRDAASLVIATVMAPFSRAIFIADATVSVIPVCDTPTRTSEAVRLAAPIVWV